MKTITILLVEDSLADACYVEKLLARTGEVVHAETLTEARVALSAEYDVVLLDLNLPDTKGLDTFQRMIDLASHLPIVILTGFDDEETSVKAVQLGAQDYILKDEVNRHSLLRTIRYAIERKKAEQDSKRMALLEQREEFMTALTHDLKNPLLGANRILELMAEQVLGPLSTDHTKLLLQLRDNNNLLLTLIQNLSEVDRVASTPVE